MQPDPEIRPVPAARPRVELTGFGKFAKWVIAPLALAAIGYRYVAPLVGGIPLVKGPGIDPQTVENRRAALAPPSGKKPMTPAEEFERIRLAPQATRPPRTP